MAILTHHSHSDISLPNHTPKHDILRPFRHWVNQLEVTNRQFAHWICRVIPCCCPFERDISLLGHTLHVPALCKLNPLYNELVGLRFRALAYLSDVCHEDVTRYIC
jgi:hypothetical protein